MIKSFRHKGLKQFFVDGNAKLLDPSLLRKIQILLDALETSMTVQDMNLPGVHLHELKGDRQGEWSVRVSGNWRLTFSFHDGDAFSVDLEDYH